LKPRYNPVGLLMKGWENGRGPEGGGWYLNSPEITLCPSRFVAENVNIGMSQYRRHFEDTSNTAQIVDTSYAFNTRHKEDFDSSLGESHKGPYTEGGGNGRIGRSAQKGYLLAVDAWKRLDNDPPATVNHAFADLSVPSGANFLWFDGSVHWSPNPATLPDVGTWHYANPDFNQNRNWSPSDHVWGVRQEELVSGS
jgi:prepilin-type processing-associated H-X9-DG protein